MYIHTHHNILYSRTCTHLARMRNDLARTCHHLARICQDCARIAPFPRPLCTHARTSVHHATHFLLCPIREKSKTYDVKWWGQKVSPVISPTVYPTCYPSEAESSTPSLQVFRQQFPHFFPPDLSFLFHALSIRHVKISEGYLLDLNSRHARSLK